MTLLHLFGGNDEAKIAGAGFDAAQSAVTAAIEIDFTRAGRDACVLKMRLERNQFRLLFV